MLSRNYYFRKWQLTPYTIKNNNIYFCLYFQLLQNASTIHRDRAQQAACPAEELHVIHVHSGDPQVSVPEERLQHSLHAGTLQGMS